MPILSLLWWYNHLINSSCKIHYQGYIATLDCDRGIENLKLLHRDGIFHSTFPIHQNNDMWYHTFNFVNEPAAKLNRMNDTCILALWHDRLGCAGNLCMDIIQKHVKGIDRPLQHNLFYKWACYLPNKMSKQPMRTCNHETKKNKHYQKCAPKGEQDNLIPDNDEIKGKAGQRFHMDFGFIRGSKYRIK